MRRKHRIVTALDGISFSLRAGELVGYIGPNGAGKSTTIKILAGILVPDRGRVEVGGRVPWKQRIEHVARIGVVFGQRTQLWWDLPVVESLEMMRHIYKVPAEQFRSSLDELIALLDLAAVLDTPVRQLSLGQRMRADLAASLVHAPAILFLDEPSIGLDAVSKLAMRAFVKRLNRERGVTVILTTHDMDDIEALCDRVIVIGDGAILSDGTLADLRKRVTRERWLTVDLADDSTIDDPDAKVIRREGERVWLAFDPDVVAPAELIRRITARHAVRDLFVENPPIETIIARMYEAVSGYFAVVAARFRALLQYRAAALGGLFTQTFFGLVRIMILQAFYAASTVAAPRVVPMALPHVVGYVWLGQATLLLIPWRADEDVAEQIRSGTVVYELTRPLDLYGMWFARSIAWRTAPVFLRMVPMFVIAMVVVPAIAPGWELAAPPSIAAFAMWIACFIGAVLVSAALTTLISVSLMWTVTGDGLPMLIATFATMFGGLVIPLPLFPDWAKPVIYALPFADILDLPSRVFTGDIAAASAGWVIAHQLVWALALVALGRYLLSRGVRRVVVQGG